MMRSISGEIRGFNARGHFVERCTEGIDIRSSIHMFAADLFGGHVGQSSYQMRIVHTLRQGFGLQRAP
jgi:hypothetical protein